MQANPIWPVKEKFPKLTNDINVDICIMGGGIAGISSAYHLKNAGYKVAILEQDEIGNAATGASSGILYYGSGTNLLQAIELFGKERAQFLWKESGIAIDDISKLVEKYNIDCGFRKCGAIMVAKTEQEAKYLEQEQAAFKECSISAKILSGKEISEIFTQRSFLSGLEFDACSQIHPARFISGLAKAENLEVYENSKVLKWEQKDGAITVETPNAKVKCNKLLIATNIKPLFGLEKHFYTESSVILASEVIQNIKEFWPQEKLIWTMEDDYDMIYPEEGRCMIELYRLKGKEAKLAYYYPNDGIKIEKQWGDIFSKTKDWLPIVGKVERNIYVAVCMGDQGIVIGSITGKNMVDCIKDQENTFLDMVSPSRFI